LFNTDLQLKEELDKKEEERHQRVVEELISGFKKLEQKMREERVALSTDAIKNVIYLVFIKLYEEKKEKEEQERNRFTETSFQDYQAFERDTNTAIQKLFTSIKNDPEIKECRLFSSEDRLSSRMKDTFVMENFIKPFEQYVFYTTKVDGLGAAYEVLGQLSGKDVKVGQFFTPENIVKFMVKLAELHHSDVIYDPACGTARFLTYAMEDMIDKTKGTRNEQEKITDIKKKQLLGTDDDPTVAKLAKMNMYIHGDGKTNIKDEDGLTNFDMDDKIDVILTNPPLGDLSYQRSIYDKDFKLNRMEVIPKRNTTQEKLQRSLAKIDEYTKKIESATTPKETKSLKKRLDYWINKKTELEYNINHGNSEYVVSGKQMKGGALFLNACKQYLKKIRDNSAPLEWRGGKILIILDEGILNTDNYKEVRDFIKREFFIKAIISLTRDTFIPVSNTTTKTSILYAIKKEDINVVQKEPIFYAHAEKVGLDTRKKICANHLFNNGNDILSKYDEFKERVLASYSGVAFNRSKFEKTDFQAGKILE
jgi:type I restriction enzyme M protein